VEGLCVLTVAVLVTLAEIVEVTLNKLVTVTVGVAVMVLVLCRVNQWTDALERNTVV